jgi:NAD(P)H-flavin reductase
MNKLMHSLRVQHIRPLTQDIIQLWLEPTALFSYQAGDYLMLSVDGEQSKPFSIANAPQANNLIELHIRHNEQSEWMARLRQLQVGDTVWADEAKPQYKLQHESPMNFFIAGGTGIAPMKALLEQRLKLGLSQPTWLYWGVRHSDDLYIHDTLVALSEQNDLLHYVPVVSGDQPDWHGARGLVHLYARNEHPFMEEATVYLCGSWAMVQTAKQDLAEAGLSERRFIH